MSEAIEELGSPVRRGSVHALPIDFCAVRRLLQRRSEIETSGVLDRNLHRAFLVEAVRILSEHLGRVRASMSEMEAPDASLPTSSNALIEARLSEGFVTLGRAADACERQLQALDAALAALRPLDVQGLS